MAMRPVLFLLLSVLFVGQSVADSPRFQVYFRAINPKGLQAWINHEDGLELFSFKANLNSDNKKKTWLIDKETTVPENNKWMIQDDNVELKLGDRLYYRMYVQFNKLGYAFHDLKWTVEKLYQPDEDYIETIDERGGEIASNECKKGETIVKGEKQCKGVLLFEDDFSSDSLNPDKWMAEQRIIQSFDHGYAAYDKSKVRISNSLLYLKPEPLDASHNKEYISSGILDLNERCTGRIGTAECEYRARSYNILPPVRGAMISSKYRFTFQYGKVEIRAKLPEGDWVYPILYLLPKREIYGNGFVAGKLIVASSRGNVDLSLNNEQIGNRRLYAGATLGFTPNLIKIGLKTKDLPETQRWSQEFHKYTLIWGPERITMAVDDQVYGEFNIPNAGLSSLVRPYDRNYAATLASKTAPYDQEFFLAIGINAGGVTEFPDNSKSGSNAKPWKNSAAKAKLNFWEAQQDWLSTWNANTELIVDYVKVFAL